MDVSGIGALAGIIILVLQPGVSQEKENAQPAWHAMAREGTITWSGDGGIEQG